MTISAYISSILTEYEGMTIDINHMETGSDQYGLYKSPGRNVKDFTDGSCEITENFQLFARQSSVSTVERKESDEWLEELAYWIDDYPFVKGFPELDGSRKVTALSITGSPYAMLTEQREVLYQLSISITYIREREGI